MTNNTELDLRRLLGFKNLGTKQQPADLRVCGAAKVGEKAVTPIDKDIRKTS